MRSKYEDQEQSLLIKCFKDRKGEGAPSTNHADRSRSSEKDKFKEVIVYNHENAS